MLKAEDIYLTISGREILKGVSLFPLSPGLNCLMGPNGAGKTLLFNILAGKIRPDRGKVYLGNQELSNFSPRKLARYLAYLPQRSEFFSPFQVEDVVAMGCFVWGKCDVKEFMRRTGIDYLKGRVFTEISEGERKLVLIARLLAQRARVLLLDEPASNLDIKNQLKIYSLLRDLSLEGRTIITTEHNLYLSRFCHKVILLNRGKIIASGSPKEVASAQNISLCFDIPVSKAMAFAFNHKGRPGEDSPPLSSSKEGGFHLPGTDR